MTMLDQIGSVLTEFISWIGEVVTALTTSGGSLYALLPLFAIGIAVSVFMVAFKAIRRVTWGA